MEILINDPFYSFLFIGGGMIFLFLEIFVPSGGVLGVLSLGSTLFGIYGLFYQDRKLLGFGSIAATASLAYLGIRFGLKRLHFAGALPPETSTSVDEKIGNLLGKAGVTYTPLRPAGVAFIDGRKVDVVTPGHFIEQNVPIRVVDISGNRVVVREVSLSVEGKSP